MSGVNKVILVGNLGRDPEIRHLESGKTVASFPLATSEKYKDPQGNSKEEVEWHSVVIWGKLAEIVEKYVKKGDMLYLEGKNKTRSWEKDGVTRYTTEVVCNQMTMLGGGNQSQNESRASDPQSASQSDDDYSDLPF